MKVTVQADRKHKDKVLARHEGFMCFFDRKGVQPKAGEVVDVMIVSLLWHRDSRNYYDYTRPPKALFVRPVTDDDVLVRHSGFECSGSMCTTTANIDERDRYLVHGAYTLTPGLLNGHVITADNVNVGWNGRTATEPKKGTAYASLKLAAARGMCRIEGVPDLDQLDFYAEYKRKLEEQPAADNCDEVDPFVTIPLESEQPTIYVDHTDPAQAYTEQTGRYLTLEERMSERRRVAMQEQQNQDTGF